MLIFRSFFDLSPFAKVLNNSGNAQRADVPNDEQNVFYFTHNNHSTLEK